MTELFDVRIPMNPWVILPLVILATAIVAYLINAVILWFLRRIVQRTSKEMDDRIYQLLERYLFPLLSVAGLLLIVDAVPLPVEVLRAIHRLLILSGLLLGVFFLTKAALLILHHFEAHYEAVANIKGPVEILTKIIFVTVGAMIILDNLGISLTPLITTFGIGSLAVAIALQDTLGNFFAGLYIKADRPIELDQYVRLESGQEGYVDHIGWRSTRIRALQNNIIVVPNSKLAQTIITNFNLPGKQMALLIPIGVSYDSDPQRVEEILVDEAKKAVGEVDGLLGDPEPFVRFIPGFGDFSLNFTLTCQVRQFMDQFLVQHELRKRILKRFEKEKIHIPSHSAYLKPDSDDGSRS